MSRHPSAEIVGYYRSHTRKSAGPDSSDQELVDHIFPGLSGLLLVIKPSGISTLTAGYYFFQNGRLETRPVGADFPFLVSIPGGTPPPSIAEEAPPANPPATEFRELVQQSLALAPEIPHQPDTVAPPPPRSPAHSSDDKPQTSPRRKKLQWEIVASGLMVAAALTLLWWQYRGASGEDDSAAASQSVPSHVANLGLAVHPGEGGWRITWDPKSAPAREALRGALDVTEDDSHERIPLTASEIRAGSTTYRPIGDDIAFRLDVVTRDNALASETYRVLLKPRETEAAATPPRKAVKAEPKRNS